MKYLALALTLFLSLPNASHAHFIWVLTGSGHDAGRVQVFFGEEAEPDDPGLLDRISNAETWSVGWRGEPEKLSLTKGKASLEATVAKGSQESPVILKHTYGVFTRGNTSFLLNYYAKTYPTVLPGNWRAIEDENRLPFEIVPSRKGASTVLQLIWKGMPLAGAEVVIHGPGLKGKLEGTTDESGDFRCELPETGTYSIRGKMTQDTAGTHNGEEYDSIRHYTTLTLHSAPTRVSSLKHELPDLPQGITSFGGAIVADTLFAYGGNYGSAHAYHRKGQSNDLWSLNLAAPNEWKKLARGPRLQGLAMVQHKGLLYRVGGFTAKNKEGEDEDLQSQSGVSRYNPQDGSWQDMPALPEPRSSMDAAVVGDVLYVAGGWNMPGRGGDAHWHTTAWSMDLSAKELNWKAIAEPPFVRRALSLAAWNGKLYCIGGMRQEGGPSTEVDVYDPETDSWAKGPALLGSGMDGFGNSSFASGGSLFASTLSGSLQRLSADGSTWEFVAQMENPRFFHRMLPWRDSKLISVGGGNMKVGKVTELDVVQVQ